MGVLIDTTIVVELEHKRRSLEDFLHSVSPEEDFAIAAITASELLLGVHRASPQTRQEQRQAYVELALESLPALPFDLEAARIHARLWADLAGRGSMIGPHDLLIAATAIAHGYAVLTDNVREFARIPGLDVRQPAW